MSLTHRKGNSDGPLRPILGQKLKPGGGGSARRALSSLGSSNRRENLRLAESLLTISATEFRSKWNFDPLTETPLSQGQFLWKPMKSPTSQVPLVTKTKTESDLARCFKLPQKEVISKLNLDHSDCKVSVDSVQAVDQACNVSNVTVHTVQQTCKVSVISEQQQGQTSSISDVSVEPMKQTCTISEISEQPVGQTCHDQLCQSVKDPSCCELNDFDGGKNNIKLCTYEENNNLSALDASSRNQRQSIITDFLQVSKRPESTPKLRRIMSDVDHS